MNYVPGDLRDQLAHVGLDVVQAGLVCGSGGNLSARVPGEEACWVTAAGAWLDRLSRTSFASVRISDGAPTTVAHPASATSAPGDSVSATSAPPASAPPVSAPPGSKPASAATSIPATSATSELALHLALYRARPDINAIIHLHPQTALLLDALGEHVRIVTTDHAFYLRRVSTVPFGLPGSTALAAQAAASAADGTNCLVLSGHGCVVLADSVELAHKRVRNLEEAADLTYRALAAGRLADLRECPAEFLEYLESPTVTTV